MPWTATPLSSTLDIEGQDLPFGKVVLEELVVANSGVVHRTSGTSLSQCSKDAGGTEPVSTGSLHGFPLCQQTDRTLQSLVQRGVKLGIIPFHIPLVFSRVSAGQTSAQLLQNTAGSSKLKPLN